MIKAVKKDCKGETLVLKRSGNNVVKEYYSLNGIFRKKKTLKSLGNGFDTSSDGIEKYFMSKIDNAGYKEVPETTTPSNPKTPTSTAISPDEASEPSRFNVIDVLFKKAKTHILLYKQTHEDRQLEDAIHCLSAFIDNTPENEANNKKLAEAYNMRGMIYAGEVSSISKTMLEI